MIVATALPFAYVRFTSTVLSVAHSIHCQIVRILNYDLHWDVEGRSRGLIRGTLGVYLQILRHTEEDLSPDKVSARLDLNPERSRYNAKGVTTRRWPFIRSIVCFDLRPCF